MSLLIWWTISQLHPTLRTCSSDTILRAIKELTQGNISYTSDTGKNYDFNTAGHSIPYCSIVCLHPANWKGRDVWCWFRPSVHRDWEYDAKPTYKKFLGYRLAWRLLTTWLLALRIAMVTPTFVFIRRTRWRDSLRDLSRTDLQSIVSELIVDHVQKSWRNRNTANPSISAQTAAVRSTMTSLLLEAGRLREINGIEFNWTLFLLRSGRVKHTDLWFKDRNGWTVCWIFGKENTHIPLYPD